MALAICLVDILTPIDGAVVVLYVVVMLIAGRWGRRRDILIATSGAIPPTMIVHVDMLGLRHIGSSTLPASVSLFAVAIAAPLVLQSQAAADALSRSERRDAACSTPAAPASWSRISALSARR
ncbi:hypothetical protein KPL78_25885 [Roseomonas sp. HJA6]|uniref:TRAP C4-dicarboxylate transport system permease DctM subunit domain-containing protein n=1 Tax=Roseomonas alba TaxID=2846776 RepID=A0ABS7AJM3_9PROT|nr:hypothetical protein [Neoroseomonas alba]MBW6401314.1 hypothetical protein [Neoroseomonas alba]